MHCMLPSLIEAIKGRENNSLSRRNTIPLYWNAFKYIYLSFENSRWQSWTEKGVIPKKYAESKWLSGNFEHCLHYKVMI